MDREESDETALDGEAKPAVQRKGFERYAKRRSGIAEHRFAKELIAACRIAKDQLTKAKMGLASLGRRTAWKGLGTDDQSNDPIGQGIALASMVRRAEQRQGYGVQWRRRPRIAEQRHR